ncbi:hypothetical protein [Kitasatospora sp. NBC_00315]|uniref:hypothetical protein n=1 Tax=Kitasatospora sp. NBC_00315 TaxID=2975963 RepID=UPI0032472F1D
MAKTQVNLRMDENVAEMAKHAAETRRVPVNDYVAQLIRDDNAKVRADFLAGAQQVLDVYGDLLDAIEDAA